MDGLARAEVRDAESAEAEPDEDALRILTVHGAKGLEFPVVLLAGLGSAPRGRNTGVEVYADRAPETWKWDAGSVAMATDQLDIDGLLALTDTRTTNYAKAPDDLRIGHMHLRVGDLEQADRFYGGAIGFDPTRKRSGAVFLSSGRYHTRTKPLYPARPERLPQPVLPDINSVELSECITKPLLRAMDFRDRTATRKAVGAEPRLRRFPHS